jgi:flagellar hook-length control protein FliK
MAAIPSGAPAQSANPVAAASGGAAPAAGTQDTAAPDVFTQLIAGMIGAGQSSPQAPGTALTDLAGIDGGADQLELSTDDRDTEGDDPDEDDESILALAALLSGLTPLPPQVQTQGQGPGYGASLAALKLATGNAGSGAETSGDALAGNPDMDLAQIAMDALTGDALTDARAVSDPLSTTAQSAPNTPTSVQMHAMLASHASQAIDALPDAIIPTPVGTPAWKDDLGTQLTWMAVNGREAASLRLSPEHLGPLDIRISMHEGEASVYFGASNAETRIALEQSLPRLREMFAAQGMVLADAGVSRDAPRNAFKPSSQPGTTRSVSDAASEASVKSVTLSRMGLIDTYV